MTDRRLLAVVLVVTGALVSMRAAAERSHCRKDCREEVRGCLGLVPKKKDCSGTRAEKKACRRRLAAQRRTCHALVQTCKQRNPDGRGTCVQSGTASCGIFLTAWGTSGSENGQFDHPLAVATDTAGNVYVGEGLFAGRIQKFDTNGTFLTTWGSYGSANGQFAGPTALATDAGGNIYVADQVNNRIQKFACP